jgi:hypothetical protein
MQHNAQNKVPCRIPAAGLPVVYFDLINVNIFFYMTFAIYGNSQPAHTLVGFDAVAVAPAMFVILHIIVEYENICQIDLFEKTAPGDIRRLKDYTFHDDIFTAAGLT